MTKKQSKINKLTVKKKPEIAKAMKVKIGETISAEVTRSFSQLADYEFPAKTGYWISKAFSKYMSAAKEYDATRAQTFRKHAGAKKGEKLAPNAEITDKKSVEAFNKEMDEFHEQEIELLLLNADLILEDLEKSNNKVKPSVLVGIAPLLFEA